MRLKVKLTFSQNDNDDERRGEEGNVMFVLKNHWTFLLHDIHHDDSLHGILPYLNDAWNIQFEVNFPWEWATT